MRILPREHIHPLHKFLRSFRFWIRPRRVEHLLGKYPGLYEDFVSPADR